MIQNTAEGERQVTVLGGSKSAYDAVYMFASNGFAVHWVIRKSGYGPSMFFQILAFPRLR